MDLLVGNPILSIGLATVLSWLWFSYLNSPARKVRRSDPGEKVCLNVPPAGELSNSWVKFAYPLFNRYHQVYCEWTRYFECWTLQGKLPEHRGHIMLTTFQNLTSGLLDFSKYQPHSVGG